MNELVNSLRRFLARDAVFILGGSAVILSFCYAFDRAWILDMPKPLYFVAAGFAYVVGYALQDVACLVRLVATASFFEPWPLLKKIYRRYTHTDWVPVARFDTELAWLQIERAAAQGNLPESSVVRFERLVVLKQVGTTLGPCCLVSCGFLVYRASVFHDPFDIALTVAELLFGAGFVVLGWLKAIQQIELMHRLNP